MEESLSKFMNESAKRHEENFNLIKEIRASRDTAMRNQGASIKALKSFGLLYGDYIELNDLKEPQELKRNPVDNLEPTIKEILEDMGPYLDEGILDVIVGEPFCKVSYVEARRFDGIITIRDGDDSVTYQMVWSNPKFKHLSNEKCNKISPLLKDLAGKKLTALVKLIFRRQEEQKRSSKATNSIETPDVATIVAQPCNVSALSWAFAIEALSYSQEVDVNTLIRGGVLTSRRETDVLMVMEGGSFIMSTRSEDEPSRLPFCLGTLEERVVCLVLEKLVVVKVGVGWLGIVDYWDWVWDVGGIGGFLGGAVSV
ncbi:hypothetical protein Tco_0397888 [Tanacetum coccineum]